MDLAGIEMSIISLPSPGVQSVMDPRKATEQARSVNEYAASVMQRYPTRFSAFAAVALQDPRGAAEELERTVRQFGFKGALISGYTNIGPNESVQYLDEEPVREFWAKVSELDVPVYLHPREPLPSQRRSIQGYPELFGIAYGTTYETASHALRLMLSGLFDRHPNVQVILGHLGEGLPYILPRTQHRLEVQHDGARGARALRRPSYYLTNNFWLTTSGHYDPKSFLEAIEQIGEDRVLFSADYPYERMTSAARWFDDAQFSNALKLKVGRENAKRLFGLRLNPVSTTVTAGIAA